MENLKKLLLKYTADHPSNLVSFVAKKTGLSRVWVHKNLRELLEQGEIVNLSHKKTRPKYVLGRPRPAHLEHSNIKNKSFVGFHNFERQYLVPIVQPIFEDEVWKKYLADDLRNMNENLFKICQYGFTEMFNNVIDHSGATQATVNLSVGLEIEISILDNGIGIFEKIQKFQGSHNPREAVLHLTKGKFTTDPSRHTGQGIFFTSRVFDEFNISSNGLRLGLINGSEDDLFLEDDTSHERGTLVIMRISKQSTRTLEEVFALFTDGDEYDFSKTHVYVQLSKFRDEHLVSRSQAKRLLLNLEKFLFIALDFKGVKSVGQGFVDEVFRVFKSIHPAVKINYVNANENIDFMIKRGVHS